MKYYLLGGLALIVLGALSFGMWVMGTYNGLVTQNQVVATSWSQVETQYQRRFDLIPNLVAATKGYLNQEQTVFKDIADARTHYSGAASGSNAQVQAAGQYESAIGRLLVVMENYPVLKSNETVKALTDELAGTENRVLVSRDRYNEQVRVWNTSIATFPRSLLAGMFGFQPKEFFKSDEGASKAPTVNLIN